MFKKIDNYKIPCEFCISFAICRPKVLEECKKYDYAWSILYFMCSIFKKFYTEVVYDPREKEKESVVEHKFSILSNKMDKLFDIKKNTINRQGRFI
ncbi:MAG: hypothetical protein ACFFG0_01340 [Candidatus Thorarchaeota archaeon]